MNQLISPHRSSWVNVPANSDFPIQNLPFGIFKTATGSSRICTAIGEQVVDLYVLAEQGFFDDITVDREIFQNRYLNDFIALGKEKTRAVRHRLAEILDKEDTTFQAKERASYFLHPQATVELLLPIKIGDYTDFYSSREHATNVGSLFRDPSKALLPNWLHLPVAYHGRASSIVVSGTPIHRPNGQRLPEGQQQPIIAPTEALDFELEVAFVLGKSTELGQSISTAEAEDYIFGLVLFNDWSARDIQSWEYQPLGPFLSKNFASTISPWVVTLDALEPFRVNSPVQEPTVLPYLQYEGKRSFDIQLEVYLQPLAGQPYSICRSNFKYLYWNMAQQLAHHTINGCAMNVGDCCASGTISGSTPDSYGSLLELTKRGKEPLHLPDGSIRTFLEDGDTIILKGYCQNGQVRIGFGEARGTIEG